MEGTFFNIVFVLRYYTNNQRYISNPKRKVRFFFFFFFFFNFKGIIQYTSKKKKKYPQNIKTKGGIFSYKIYIYLMEKIEYFNFWWKM